MVEGSVKSAVKKRLDFKGHRPVKLDKEPGQFYLDYPVKPGNDGYVHQAG